MPCYQHRPRGGVRTGKNRYEAAGGNKRFGGQVIVVAGLAFEARIAAGPGLRVICSGNGTDLAGKISRALTRDCKGLISFGVAGGLDPDLQPGTCVIASAVLSGKSQIPTDRRWSDRLLEALPNPVHGTVLGVGAPVADPEAKRALYMKTGALAVDMESHIVANVASARGLPMAAIRVITDPARRAIPNAALAAMRDDGTVDLMAMCRSLIATPRELTALFRTALDNRAARASLRQGRQLLGPRLGLPETREERYIDDRTRSQSERPTGATPGFVPYLPSAGLFADQRAFQKAD